jgi:hypothetical protein
MELLRVLPYQEVNITFTIPASYVSNETFVYDGSTLEFTTSSPIDSIVSLDINGLVEDEGSGFEVSGNYKVKLLGAPAIGSKIGVVYLS